MLDETAEKIIMIVAQGSVGEDVKAKVIDLLMQFGLATMHDSSVQNELFKREEEEQHGL